MCGIINLTNPIFFIGVLFLLPISIRFGKYILERDLGRIRDKLKEKKDREIEPSHRLEALKEEKMHLEDELKKLSNLYTITREMSFDIRFNELFGSLKNFLEDNFGFKRINIILFKYEDEKKIIDKVYEINKEFAGFIKPNEDLDNIVKSIAHSKKPIYVENILAIPLIARGRTISAILCEDMKKEDKDRFLILASQVALQVERIHLFESVERISIMDGLTGTFLRRHFLSRFEEETERAKQSGMNLSFIMADLDYFKQCNDNLGHMVGDVVLKEVAGLLKENVREIDLVARYGGEEFSILLPEANKTGAHAVAERIRKAVENHVIKAYDESVRITISMGISSFPEDSKNTQDLIEMADKALYEAKRQGRNRICLA